MSIPFQMMKNGFSLGRVFGIDVNINQSALFLALMVAMNGFAVFGFSGLAIILVPVFVLLLMFSILAHEFGHALTARRFGIETDAITLHALGGVAKINGEPRTPRAEFLVAVAGPAVSFLLAVVFFGLAVSALVLGLPGMGVNVLEYLMFTNVALGVFNMLPGLPLDGGRALRAILWHFKKDRDSATLTAARGGEIIGLIFYFLAFLNLASSSLGGAMFAGFMGWFLRSAAKGERMRVLSKSGGQGQARNIFDLLRQMQAMSGSRRGFGGPKQNREASSDDFEVIRYPDGREVHIKKR